MDIISEYKAGRRDFAQANCYRAKLAGAVLAALAALAAHLGYEVET